MNVEHNWVFDACTLFGSVLGILLAVEFEL